MAKLELQAFADKAANDDAKLLTPEKSVIGKLIIRVKHAANYGV